MKKWEYIEKFRDKYHYNEIEFLNNYGQLGWELVLREGNYYTFKRELKEESQTYGRGGGGSGG
jgi:hypothetical protein